jgi:hypothetical protein
MRARTTTLALALVLAIPAIGSAQQQPEKKPDAPKPQQAKPDSVKADSAKAAPAADAAKDSAKAAPAAAAANDSAKAAPAAAAAVEVKAGGDVAPATATQLLGAVTEAGASAAALATAQVTDVRLVSSADVLDPAGATALGLIITKHDADIAKLRQATAVNEKIKAALATANVPNDRVIGVAVNGSVATVFHRAP